MRMLLLLLLATLSIGAHARMYQWVDPVTGTTQFSGKPPSWYRTDAKGPRVFAFENGQLIDDTAIDVSPEQRDALRMNAFATAEAEERDAATARALEAAKLRRALQKSEQEAEQEPAADLENLPPDLAEVLAEKPPKGRQEPTPEETDAMVKRLKEIVEAFDKRRTEEARSVLDSRLR